MNLIAMNTQITMSSLEIAELTNSHHFNTLKAIRALIDRGVIFGNETPYVHPQNGQTYTEIKLNYRDTMIVVSGYSVELRARIIDRWQELEAKQAPAIPQTYAAALMEAGRLALEVEQQAAQLALAAPKVEFHDKYMAEDGLTSFSELVKLLQLNETPDLPRSSLRATQGNVAAFLACNGIMHRVNGKLVPYAKWNKSGYFGMKKTPSYGGHVHTDSLFTPKGVKWITRKWAEWKDLRTVEAA